MEISKKERRAEFNRNNIIDAAYILFEKNGFDKTSMDDIAKAADYSKSTIYIYFKSKEEIYAQITLRGMQMLKECVVNKIKTYSESERCFYEICNALVEFQKQKPLCFSSILDTIDVTEEKMEQLPVLRKIYEVGEELKDEMIFYLNKGIEKGELRQNLHPLSTVFTIWSNVGGVIQMASAKKLYFEQKLKIESNEFLNQSFENIWYSIKK